MKARICPKCGRYNLESVWYCANQSCRETLSVNTITDIAEPLPPDVVKLLQDDSTAEEALMRKELSVEARLSAPSVSPIRAELATETQPATPEQKPGLREKLVIKNPFWAGFVLGLGGAWFGSMLAGTISLCSVAASSPYAGPNYSGTGSCLGLLLGIAVASGFIALVSNSRTKAGYPEASASGIVSGVVVYLAVGFLVLAAITRTPFPDQGIISFPTKTLGVARTPSPTRTPFLVQGATLSPKTPSVGRTPSLAYTASPTSTPGGPAARVVASMSNSMPCERYEGDGCQWSFTVTFTEEKGIATTIESLCRRYIDRDGGVWTSWGGSGWFSETIKIPAYGSNLYNSWVRTKARTSGDLMGGTVEVCYSGHDANGNPFSGIITSTLAWPVWPTFTPTSTQSTATP